MRTTGLVGAAMLGVVLVGTLTVQAREIERSFVSGGTVRLELEAGDYEIVGSPSDRIRVTWDEQKHDTGVTVRIDTAASRATVRTDTPWHDGAKVRIELPRRTNLVVKMSAGAGDVTIGVGSREKYRYVNASVSIGDLSADPFNVNKDGLFRSFEWTGKGQYELRARLTVGDLKLD